MELLLKHSHYHNKFLFKIIDKPYDLAVERFDFEEKMSVTFVVTLWLLSEYKIEVNSVIYQDALLTIKGSNNNRYCQGIINHFIITGKRGRFFSYQATLVPWLWFLSLNKRFRAFQNLTVVEIVTDIIEENNIPLDSYEFRLTSDYQRRRYCTQYGESDLHFISRLLEGEGIFYFFEHREDMHLMVLADNTAAYKRIDGETEVGLHYDAGMVSDTETIERFGYLRSIRPGRITQNNYNFKRPSLDLKVVAEDENNEIHELFEYPGDYCLPEEGERRAQVRLEEKKTLEESAEGTSNCSRFQPGYTFKLIGHDFRDLNKEYLLVTVKHTGSQFGLTGEYAGLGGEFNYSNDFLAIPASVILRPEKTFKKPYVCGLQSAVVTGPEGHEIHTDEYGRVKVQFHWDREGKKNDRSSCWLRTSQPWSGNGWGFVSLPRVGDEVLVAFINGDPDWPIVVGNVNNAASPALYRLPANKSQSGIRTRSTPGGGPDNFNELRFEDKKGSEEVFLQAEKDFNLLVKNDKTEKVQANETEIVGADKTVNVAKGFDITVGEAFSITCGKSKITMDAAGNVTITGTSFRLEACGPVKVTGEPIEIN